MSTQNDTNQEKINSNIRIAVTGFFGIIIFLIHAALLYFNLWAFNVLVSLYIITYAVFILILTYKNKTSYNNISFNLLVNFSLYTIILQIFLLVFFTIKIATKK